MTEGSWLPQERLVAVEGTDLAYLRTRLSDAMKYNKLLTYSHGNVDSAAAQLMHNTVAANIPSSASTASSSSDTSSANAPVDRERARALPAQRHVVLALPAFNEEDPNSALITHFQADFVAPRNSALLMVVRRLLGEPAFTELRTKQQLGYIVNLAVGGYGRFVVIIAICVFCALLILI